MSLLNNLQAKSNSFKQRTAFIGALLGVVIIAVIWALSLSYSLPGNVPEEDSQEKPFSVIGEAFGGAKEYLLAE